MISLLLFVCVLLLWRRTVTLRRRVERLEAGLAHDARPAAREPAIPDAPAAGSLAEPAAPPAPETQPLPLPATPHLPHAPAPAPAPALGLPEDAAATSAQGWEVIVGSSWLNKAGVLIFVTGLALLLGYSMAHVGPLGRVVMGFALATTMLTAGVLIERRAANRAYGHGLVAGGWAGIYVTTFATHVLPAAKVIDSDLIALLALLAVAGAMVWHSLRYRSQTVTSLAYVAASLPLALTPLSTFSVLAALPLAASLLAVAQRFGWSGLSLLGVGSAYLLFALRVTGHGPMALHWTLEYGLLATYWLTFEIADLIPARSRSERPPPQQASIFSANVIGSIGCLVLLQPFEDPDRGALVVGGAAIAYFGAAVLRARMRPPAASGAAERPFDSSHAALAVSAGLLAWAVHMRFGGPQAVIALLLEAQLLVASGLLLGDGQVRRIGGVVAAWVTLRALAPSIALPAEFAGWPWQMSAWTRTQALVAACWYVTHEWMRRRGVVRDIPEHLYSWVASGLVGAIIAREVSAPFAGVMTLAFAVTLLAAGTRPAPEYRYQSYIALFLGLRMTVVPTLTAGSTLVHVDAAMFGATALAYAFAWWVLRRRSVMSAAEQRFAAIEAGSAAVILLIVAEWHAAPRPWIGSVWAASALVLTAVAAARRMPGLRWQAYALSAVAALLELAAVALDASSPAAASALTVAALYATGLIGRPGVRRAIAASRPSAQIDRAGRLGVILSATVLLTMLLADRLAANLVTMAWGLEGIVLLTAGFTARERVLRLLGLALLFLCILKLFVYDLRELEALGRILSFVVLGLVLLGVSWTYTKYREQIQKLL